MTIEETRIGSRVVLKVTGRMDADSALAFKGKCESCISEGATTLVIDLGDVDYVSSMGLGCFVSIANTLREKGGELRVCRLKGLVKQVFEITCLNRVFAFHESVESALMGN